MPRKLLRNDQWDRIKDLLPGKAGDPGTSAKDNRLFIEAVSDDQDLEMLFIDSTAVRAHQHAAGTQKKRGRRRSVARAGT